MDGKILLFDAVNETMAYITREKPGMFIPFKGNFPLVRPGQEELFRQGTENKMYLEECEPWIQNVLIKAKRMVDIDRGFHDYLKENNILKTYSNMNSKQKAGEIVRFLRANCLSVESLTIKSGEYNDGEF